jgi:NADPH:quinone reductase-like Zn-dependent oxidoreductase
MVRRVVIPRNGDVNVLEVREGPPDALAPGAVRIRVAAAGVNFADLLMRMGLYPEAPSKPFVPGYEVAGTVTEASADAARARPDLAVGCVRGGTALSSRGRVVVPVAKLRRTTDRRRRRWLSVCSSPWTFLRDGP